MAKSYDTERNEAKVLLWHAADLMAGSGLSKGAPARGESGGEVWYDDRAAASFSAVGALKRSAYAHAGLEVREVAAAWAIIGVVADADGREVTALSPRELAKALDEWSDEDGIDASHVERVMRTAAERL